MATWSIVFVPYMTPDGLLSSHVITMKAAPFYSFVFNDDGANAVADGDGDMLNDARVAAANTIVDNADVIIANNDAAVAARVAGRDIMNTINGVGGRAIVKYDNTAAAAQINNAIARKGGALNETKANNFFTNFFNQIETLGAKTTVTTNAFFDLIDERLTGTINPVEILPPLAVAPLPNSAAFRQALTVNVPTTFAYLLLLKYPPIVANQPAKHSSVYYKKYTATGVALTNLIAPLFSVFNQINLLANAANATRGGSGHSSILAQYMPQLGRKQSKKHRRKYAKGRTARR